MKVFVEYKIVEKFRREYLQFIEELLNLYSNLEVIEGIDQNGLFVEIWTDISLDQYYHMKNQRKISKEAEWQKIRSFMADSPIHVWGFKPLSP